MSNQLDNFCDFYFDAVNGFDTSRVYHTKHKTDLQLLTVEVLWEERNFLTGISESPIFSAQLRKQANDRISEIIVELVKRNIIDGK